jgi:hypothetical protein
MVVTYCRALGAVVVILCVSLLAGEGLASHLQSDAVGGISVQYSNSRIAIDADGNFNDPDDWAASPVGLAILSKLGRKGRLVHYSYNNYLGRNSSRFYQQMSYSINRSISLYGLRRSVFFDAQRRLDAAIENLRRQIDRSSSSDRLFIIAAGPMELTYRAVKRASPAKRSYVTVISHSNCNNKRQDPPQMTHNYLDVRRLGVKWLQIPDQNPRLYTNGFQSWHWMRDARDSRLRFLYGRMTATGKPDVSDAGMVYFLLRNDPRPTPDKLRRLLSGRG